MSVGGWKRIDHTQNVLSFQRLRMAVVNEVSFLCDSEAVRSDVEFSRRKQFLQFRARPAIELALVPFAVGIFGGIESAGGMRHVAQDVIEDVAGDGGVIRFLRRGELRESHTFFAGRIRDSYNSPLRNDVGIEIELRELRVVVEHLLEMRHE